MSTPNSPEHPDGPDTNGSDDNRRDDNRSDRRGSDQQDGVINPLRFLAGGVEFAVTCAAGALGGRWIDARLGTGPWFTVVLLVTAFATATWLLLRALSTLDRDAGTGEKGHPR